MSSLRGAFGEAREAGRGALVAYLMAGDPDADRCVAYAAAAVRGGADILELGVPFSDPIADGPAIQAAGQRALAAGMTPRRVLGLVERVREATAAPVVLMTYYNPVLQYGEERFCADLRGAGGSGLIVPDLPFEEAEGLRSACAASSLDLVPLLTPATGPERAAAIARTATGFLYVVSRYGTTGGRGFLALQVRSTVARAREAANGLPVAVGFGISRPEQVAEVLDAGADGAVVGSALVERVGAGDAPEALEALVRHLTEGLLVAR